MRTIHRLAGIALLAFTSAAMATVNILACEPEWGALATELGGDKVSVYNATTALQDPHHIQAKPSLLARARSADLVVCTGSQLEIGWLPILLQQSGNPRLQPGQPGNFEATSFVRMLELPSSVDRSQGDVHPGGNPHIQTDPRNIALVAAALAKRLEQIAPSDAAVFQARYRDFSSRWQTAMTRWQAVAAPLKGLPIVVQHKGFPYLEDWLGLREVAALEPKPGVEPSSAYLTEVLAQLAQRPARLIIRAAYNDGRPSEWLAQRAHISAVELPFTVGGSDKAGDLFGLFDDTLQRLLTAVK
jgi:zinc/manganese transport system substrate-binding protein